MVFVRMEVIERPPSSWYQGDKPSLLRRDMIFTCCGMYERSMPKHMNIESPSAHLSSGGVHLIGSDLNIDLSHSKKAFIL
jgi:hypothetical protein